MNVTVLGKYSPFPPARGAGSGYWVECENPCEGSTHKQGILLDCGPGVLANFQQYVGRLSMIRFVALSHLHFDHMADMTVLRYAVSPDQRYRVLPPKVQVYAPATPQAEHDLLNYKEAMFATAVSHGDSIAVGTMKITFFQVCHPVTTHGIRIQTPSGIIAYSGDTCPCEGLIEAAKGADIFICEASATEEDREFAAQRHLTARQAGEVAKEAGVKRLLLTHIWPLYDEMTLLEECREVFPGAEIVRQGATYSTGNTRHSDQ